MAIRLELAGHPTLEAFGGQSELNLLPGSIGTLHLASSKVLPHWKFPAPSWLLVLCKETRVDRVASVQLIQRYTRTTNLSLRTIVREFPCLPH